MLGLPFSLALRLIETGKFWSETGCSLRNNYYSQKRQPAMRDAVREPAFAALLVAAAGFGVTTYMLGVLLDPVPAIVVSLGVVGIGGVLLLPDDERGLGSIIGLLSVGLAGVIAPRLVTELTSGINKMVLTLFLSGLVLLLAFAVLRTTVFSRDRPGTSIS